MFVSIHLHFILKDNQDVVGCRVPVKDDFVRAVVLCMHQGEGGGEIRIKPQLDFRQACLPFQHNLQALRQSDSFIKRCVYMSSDGRVDATFET